MYKSAKEKAEAEVKELKQQVEQLSQRILSLEVDGNKLRELEELADQRDSTAEDFMVQNKQLLETVTSLEDDCEHKQKIIIGLEQALAEYEAELENAKEDSAKMMGHSNHRQKLKYMEKLKDENVQKAATITELRQRLSHYETGQRGSTLLQALAAFGCGDNAGEMSVCAPTPGRQEPRTPAKGSTSCSQSVGARTPRRPTSAGPPSARGRGPAADAERTQLEQRLAMAERTAERTVIDFRHFVSLIDRAAFAGSAGAESADPAVMLEKLRKAVSGASS